MSLGWHGTDAQWRHYTRAYLFFAAFATPLVVSVHSVVSWDFAVSVVPGWHSTPSRAWFLISLKLLPVVSIAEMKEDLAHGAATEVAHAR